MYYSFEFVYLHETNPGLTKCRCGVATSPLMLSPIKYTAPEFAPDNIGLRDWSMGRGSFVNIYHTKSDTAATRHLFGNN